MAATGRRSTYKGPGAAFHNDMKKLVDAFMNPPAPAKKKKRRRR